jgi:hypothetical protein
MKKRPVRVGRMLLITLVAGVTLGFDQSIHERITESILQSEFDFDADSADEVGDSNYYTDIFESSNAAAHADNNQLGEASDRLRTKLREIGDELAACRRRSALDKLGEALHTVQDIFSHSNSVDNNIPISDLLNMENGTAPCDSDANFAPSGLVTGYFSSFGWSTGNQCRGMPESWCCHRELNKDNASVPNGGRHELAVAAAENATRQYLNLLTQDIRDRFPSDTATQLLKMLKKKQRAVFFVIDDTGSMSDDIAGVQSAVNSFLDELVAGEEAPTLGLVTFKDSVSNRGIFCDLAALRQQVNGLFASGGGDCPEGMNAALLEAILSFPVGRGDIQIRGGRILLATDASARDPGLGPQVRGSARAAGIAIDAILTGDCVPEDGLTADTISHNSPKGLAALDRNDAVSPRGTDDPLTSPSARTYLRALTEQTGGVLFNVPRAEVGEVAPILLDLSAPDTEVFFARRLDLRGGGAASVRIALDDTLAEHSAFMVTSSTPGVLPQFRLFRPDGTQVNPSDPDAELISLSSVTSYVMHPAQQGEWTAAIDGDGIFLLRAFGKTALRLNSLRLLDPAAPALRHVEAMPIDGEPVPGQSLIADIRLTAAVSNPTVFLRQPDGSEIAALTPTPLGSPRRFRVALTVPSVPFVLEVEGRTLGGVPFVRRVPLPVDPQLVGISAESRVVNAGAGTDAILRVTVTNTTSVEATYRLTALGNLNWPTTTPPPFALGPGASGTFEVIATVPGSAAEGTENEFNIFVENVNNPIIRNSTRVSVVVSGNQPPDCSGARASVSSLWPPNHRLEPITILGILDPDGDPVAVTLDSITQDEPVREAGNGDTAPDGLGVGSETALLRAERSGSGDGRVYAIHFTASDGRGGTCSGVVSVVVPHNNGAQAIDSGQIYDSTVK